MRNRAPIAAALTVSFALIGSGFARPPAREASKTVTLGDVEITYWDHPVEITGLEYSTNFYFELHNSGSTAVTVNVPPAQEVALPAWIFHFFDFQSQQIELAAGETRTIEYIVTNEGTGEATLELPFSVDGARAASETVQLRLISSQSPGFRDLPATATVSGTVRTSAGTPLVGADVGVYLYSGRDWERTTTDSSGAYSVSVPSVEELREAMGDRPLPYASLDYMVIVDEPGYSLGYADGVQARAGARQVADIVVDVVAQPAYDVVRTVSSGYGHGFWWLDGDSKLQSVAAVQARHPPVLGEPGEIVMIDGSGTQEWVFETGDECWGFDYAGSHIAAGCHDSMVTVLDESGTLLWQADSGSMNREVELDRKGKKLFTGPFAGAAAALLDAATGRVLWSYTGSQQWLRSSRIHKTGKWIVAGFSGGDLALLDKRGNELWAHRIGEFPMVLEIDKKGNVYAAGKNRELFSYDVKGNLRWRRRIANHVVTAGVSNIDKKGKLLVLGTVGGWLYAFDPNGNIRWQRPLPEGNFSQGHNALQVTSKGRYIVAGGSTGTVALYDADGSLLWSETFADSRNPSEYDHPQSGAIAVTVTEDASKIIAGFGDSKIRVLERR